MDETELVGGVLFGAADPIEAAVALLEMLVAEKGADPARARGAGLEPVLVEALRRSLPRERHALELACAGGAGWVLGRRSVASTEEWEVVASLPGGDSLPSGLRRTTAETLIGLVASARRIVRLAAPYIDEPGIAFLSDAILAATRRGVTVELFEPQRSTLARAASMKLIQTVGSSGDSRRFVLSRIAADAPFAHLKVLAVDGSSAYIGSANITAAGLQGRNLELGVLVRGRQVAVIDLVLDLYREPDAGGAEGVSEPS